MVLSNYLIDGPVFPIPPSYIKDGKHLDLKQVKTYIHHLQTNDVKTIMTTPGISQFNMLTNDEIYELNKCCVDNFKNGSIILGLPALPEHILEEKLWALNHQFDRNNNVAIMLSYPERFYDKESVVEYFHRAADFSKLPIFIYGNPMENGRKEKIDYDWRLINEINNHKNIIGMKEGCSTLEKGYELCRCVKILKGSFKIIVTGKSQRRWLFMRYVGADTFLAGMGSLYPKFDIHQYKCGKENSIDERVLSIEDEFFEIMIDRKGWYRSIRTALRLMNLCCLNDRKPFSKNDSVFDTYVMMAVEFLRDELNTF